MWDIDILPNNTGFVACNGTFLRFYEFFMVEGSLTFEMKRQLDIQETVLCVKISPDMKFIAAGLMDSTVKMFFLDTLKFHLSMYGHTLPVVSIDISKDSTLLVSCSGDKTVRVWGMDFGDCHCSMTHTEGLVGCNFLEKTHHVISMAKDSLNIYDADVHQRIQTIKVNKKPNAVLPKQFMLTFNKRILIFNFIGSCRGWSYLCCYKRQICGLFWKRSNNTLIQ